MRSRFLPKSVFAQLVLILAVTAIAMHLVVGMIFRHGWQPPLESPFQKQIRQYIQYMKADIGDPPDFEQARALAHKTGVMIQFKGRKHAWSTHPEMDDTWPHRMHRWPGLPEIRVGFDHGRLVAVTPLHPGELVFRWQAHAYGPGFSGLFVVTVFATVSVLMIGAYWAIRTLVLPLRDLSAGMAAVENGDLGYHLPEERTDEFGNVARGFNRMIHQVARMIRVRQRLLLDVSHELRTPITRLRLVLAMMEEGEIKRSMAEDIEEISQMVTSILEQARESLGPDQLQISRIDIAALVAERVARFQGQAPGIVLENAPATATLMISGDGATLRKMVDNILVNALKYSTITEKPVQVRLSAAENRVIIAIEDSGIGIPASEIPFVCEPFYRVDPSRMRETGGFGLGLCLAKAVAEAHAGHITIQSIEGQGTTVRIDLPTA